MLEKNISLLPYNTLGISSHAAFFARVKNQEELKAVLAHPLCKDLPLLVLGQGSNVLLLEDFQGLVIKMEITGKKILQEDAHHVWVEVGAGENWHEFVLWAVDQGYAGVENLSLIPGTVGAAPMQNIGAYGVELKEVFEELQALEIASLDTRVFDKEACDFGYRQSVFKTRLKGKFIICKVVFKLSKKPVYNTSYGDIQATLDSMEMEASIKSISEAVIRIRQSKLPDPKVLGNAGSFFKNPSIPSAQFDQLKANYPFMPFYPQAEGMVKVPAGWLIEQCGWKGKQMGRVGVHERQALVIVNLGGAEGWEIKELAEKIQASVLEKFGITLEAEVNFISGS